MKVKDWYKENKKYFSLSELNFIFKSFALGSLHSLDKGKKLNFSQAEGLKRVGENRLRNIPLAYSLGREEFFGNMFELNSETLIPRPETELLVEKAKEIIEKEETKIILDLCCGCGNIGISLEKSFSERITVYLSDLSLKALALAKRNSVNLDSDIHPVASNLFSAFKLNSFDLIITNPPYVESRNIKGSLIYEPRQALDGGGDGLFFIRKILSQASNYLKDNGWFIMEFGCGQKEKIKEIIIQSRQYRVVEWVKDYACIWRGVVLQKWINS